MQELRESGIDVLGKIPWGTHFCNFYETKQDLLDTLVPYFKTGLESNEFCLWVVSNSELITVEEAKEALERVIPGLDQHLSNKNIEVLNGPEWYLEENVFNLERIMKAWDAKLKRALAHGYDGMRVSGDTLWLSEKYWKDFYVYEKQLNDSITDLPMTVLCTYPLAKSGAAEILDVAHNHQFAIARRHGEWEIIETPELIEAKAEIKKLNEELEQKVVERTDELAKTVGELKNEISEREKIEADLRTSELRYKTLIEQASDAIIITDEDGHLIEVNNSFCKMVGYTEKELIGVDVTALIDSEHLKVDPLRFDLLLEGKALFRERLMKRRDGTIFPMEEHVKMLSDKRILAIVRDITERKQAEDALRQNEDRMRLVIDTVPALIHTGLPDGQLDFFNQRWLDFVGLSLEDLSGWKWTAAIHPGDVAAMVERWRTALATGEPYEHEARVRRADGEYRWMVHREVPLCDEQGNILKWYASSIDIEDRKRAEDALHQSEDRIRLIIDTIPIIAWSVRPDGTVDFLNQRWLQ
jgi:PAS domain S-box-containing protein